MRDQMEKRKVFREEIFMKNFDKIDYLRELMNCL